MNIAYIRKSTDRDDMQALSLEAQEKIVKELANKDGTTISKIYVDKITATKPKVRPAFNDMIKDINKGKIQNIYAWKIDRIARNPIDEGEIKWALQNNLIKKITCHDRTYLPSDNVLIVGIEFDMANQYVRELSVNSARGVKLKAEKGGWNFKAPLGYKNNKNTNCIEIDEEKAPYIRRMFRLRAKGMGEKEISDTLYKEGLLSKAGIKVGKSSIHNYLRNPVYIGLVIHKGEWYKGQHEPLIANELWKQVKGINTANRHQKKTNHSFIFKGIFGCGECGCSITAERQKGHIYYRCTKKKGPCSQKYIREEKLEEIILDFFNSYEIPPVIAEDISKKASLFLDRNSKEIERLNKLNENQIRDLNRKLKKIKQMRMDDELDREEYLEDKNEILSKISNLEEDHKKKIEDLDMRIEDFLDWLELMKSLSSWAKGMGPVLWGNILYSFGSNFLLKDGKIVIEQKTELFKAIESYSVQFGSSSTTMYELLSTFLRSDYYIKKMLNLEHSHSQSQQ